MTKLSFLKSIFIQTLLREEERLAATLANIEQDALIIPRGAYILQPNGDVERNRTFEGQINNCLFFFLNKN